MADTLFHNGMSIVCPKCNGVMRLAITAIQPAAITLSPTDRGFVCGEFSDLYDVACSIQESSLATDNAVWLGRDKGIHIQTTGDCFARMHLNQGQVAALIPVLQYFVEHGKLPKQTAAPLGSAL